MSIETFEARGKVETLRGRLYNTPNKAQVARDAGVNRIHIYSIINGAMPRLDTYEALVAALDKADGGVR